MKVIIDKHIPYIQGEIEPYAEVLYLEPQEMTASAVHDADALIVRTLTRCNRELLQGSSVRFIATATIGFDHIDTAYCAEQGISWTNAPGCNAQGVCDYIETAIDYAGQHEGKQRKVIGIVGVGHVGQLVAQMAKRKGYTVLLNDPPRAEKEGSTAFVSIEELTARADIITFHTPLTTTGAHPTHYLCNESMLNRLRPDTLLINAARGGVIQEEALLQRMQRPSAPTLIIDCWEHEPDINTLLLSQTLLGTYHIAGYTQQGKRNATRMCLQALSRHFGIACNAEACTSQGNSVPLQGGAGFDIEQTSRQLKHTPEQFKTLRENYPLR